MIALEDQESRLGTNIRFRLDPKLVEKWEKGVVCPRLFYQARLCLLFEAGPEELDLPATPGLRREIDQLSHWLHRGAQPSFEMDQIRGVRQIGGSEARGYAGVAGSGLLDGLQAVTASYGRLRDVAPPMMLRIRVEHHLEDMLDVLRVRSDVPPGPVLRIAAQVAIMAGWLAFNLDRRGSAMSRWILAYDLARDAGSSDLEAYALGCRSRLYSSIHCDSAAAAPSRALAMLNQAVDLESRIPDGRLRSWLLANRAEERAAGGRAAAAARDLERAQRTLDDDTCCDDVLFAHWSRARFDRYRGSCARLNGRPAEAVELLEAARWQADPSLIPHRVFTLTELASASSECGEAARACSLLTDSLIAAHRFGLVEARRRIHLVRMGDLARWGDHPALRAFDEQTTALAWGDGVDGDHVD